MRSLYVDESLCRGCTYCELACSFAKEGEFNPTNARLYVVKDDQRGVEVPVVCNQCGKCAEACPEKAIYLDRKTNAWLVDQKKCTGCGDCIEVCPCGVIFLHPETGKATKCDLCRGKPECVTMCPFGAIQYLDQSTINRMQREPFFQDVVARTAETVAQRGII